MNQDNQELSEEQQAQLDGFREKLYSIKEEIMKGYVPSRPPSTPPCPHAHVVNFGLFFDDYQTVCSRSIDDVVSYEQREICRQQGFLYCSYSGENDGN